MAAGRAQAVHLSKEIDLGMAHQELLEKGFTVLPSVVSHDNCDLLRGQVQEWLRTFPEGEFPVHSNSIINSYGISHSEPMWRARGLVKHVYAGLWNTNKLLTSFDGLSIGRPAESGKEKFYDEKKPYIHCDQSTYKLGLHAYQGALYLESAEADDWCFKVLSHSHKHHTEFFKENERDPENEFRLLNDQDITWYTSRGCTVTKVPVPKGGMVLWDSRTIHAGKRAEPGRANAGRWRFVMFISMTPAIWARPKDLEARREAYHNIEVSTHWSSQGFKIHPCQVKTSGEQTLTQLPPSALTAEARLLAGIDSYDFSDGQSNGPKSMPKWS